MFRMHGGVNVMSYFMEEDVRDPDLPEGLNFRESGGLQAQNNSVYAKFNIC
jgi:hypothetical protein